MTQRAWCPEENKVGILLWLWCGLHAHIPTLPCAFLTLRSVLHYALRKLYPMSLPPGSARFARPCVSPDDAPRVAQLLSIPVFHTSLLTISAMLVCSITGHGQGKHGQVGHRLSGGLVPDTVVWLSQGAYLDKGRLGRTTHCRFMRPSGSGMHSS